MPVDTVGISRAFHAQIARRKARAEAEWIITVSVPDGIKQEFYPPRTNHAHVGDRQKAALAWLLNQPSFTDCTGSSRGFDIHWRPVNDHSDKYNPDGDSHTRTGEFRLQKLDATGRFRGYL